MPVKVTTTRRPKGQRNPRIPGAYESIRDWYAESADKLSRQGDPRAFAIDDPAQRRLASATSRGVSAARRALESVHRGEPQRVLAAMLRNAEAAQQIPWLADRFSGIREAIVYPDDSVTPAERHPGAVCCDGGPVLGHEEGCPLGPRGDWAAIDLRF